MRNKLYLSFELLLGAIPRYFGKAPGLHKMSQFSYIQRVRTTLYISTNSYRKLLKQLLNAKKA